MESKFELIMCIVNQGFSDAVMDAAREHGAGGGTILNARGTANPLAEKLFNVVIEPEKEIVLIVVKKEKTDEVMGAIYDNVGLKTAGAGIAFCMPVDNIVGLPDKQL